MSESTATAKRLEPQKSAKEVILGISYKYGTLFAILAAIVFFSIKSPYFLTFSNIADVLRSVAVITLMAIGVTFSATTDGFDVSVGSITGFATEIAGALMVWWEMPLILVITVPIFVGTVIGIWNSFLIEKFKIPDILATLSTMFIVQGILITFTKGYSIYQGMSLPNGDPAPGKFYDAFKAIGQSYIFGVVPTPVVIVLIFVVIAHIFLNYTKFGRFLYMTGGNREAARLSGVPVVAYRVLSYALSGMFAGIAGVMLAARTGMAEVNAGASLLMTAIAATNIGYSVLGKGKANVFGTFCGAFLMGVLLNGLTMMNVMYYAQDIVKGAVLVFALVVSYGTKKNK